MEMREEEWAQKEFKKAQQQAEKEHKLVINAIEETKLELTQAADLEKLLLQTKLDELYCKLVDAEEKNQRAISMAQLPKQGHVYIVSNVGSFGENVLKVGMTRRIDPLERIEELGEVAVPFNFDVHAIIYSENAPKLEQHLHAKLKNKRLNKVDHRKDFFRVALGEVRMEIESLDLKCHWTMKAQALEFRESEQFKKSLIEEKARALETLEIG